MHLPQSQSGESENRGEIRAAKDTVGVAMPGVKKKFLPNNSVFRQEKDHSGVKDHRAVAR